MVCSCSPGRTGSRTRIETAYSGWTTELEADEVLRRAHKFFGRRTGSFALWAREHGDAELEARARRDAMRDLGRLPELVLDHLPPELPLPDGVELRQALDEETRNDYLGVVAKAWGMAAMPLRTAAHVFFDPASLDAPNVAAYVAYFDGQPLSGAMTLVTHGVALGCQGATIRRPKPGQRLPAVVPGQQRGLAESCLWMALRTSFAELGAWCSLGQTSEQGAPVWERLGYRPLTSYGRYLVPAARPGGQP